MIHALQWLNTEGTIFLCQLGNTKNEIKNPCVICNLHMICESLNYELKQTLKCDT